MLDLSPDKLLMLAVVALVVLGPNRLPGVARTMGRVLGQMRAMSGSFQTEVREALHDPEDAITSAIAEFRPSQVRRTMRRAVTETVAPFGPSAAAGTTTPIATNLPPAGGSAPSPVSGVEPAAPPATGWDGHPVPDDPGFN